MIRAFYQARCDEDLQALSDMLADTLKYRPPSYNGNQWLWKEGLLAALKGYHENYENIKYSEGIVMPDSTANGYWSGSVFPEANASSSPNVIRAYGTWMATHTASGKEVGIKFYSLTTLNDAGKITTYSDYFDRNSLLPKDE